MKKILDHEQIDHNNIENYKIAIIGDGFGNFDFFVCLNCW